MSSHFPLPPSDILRDMASRAEDFNDATARFLTDRRVKVSLTMLTAALAGENSVEIGDEFVDLRHVDDPDLTLELLNEGYELERLEDGYRITWLD